jgi:hypothetical protein
MYAAEASYVPYHKKKVGVWKLSVFRPERKNDSGEFIPP